jgi:hypothetical protein
VIKNNATSNVTLSPSGDVILSPAAANKLIYTDIDKKLKSTPYDPDDVVIKDPISGEVLINGYLNLVSTTKGSVSCPVMTEAQRDLIATPALGECVFNSSSETLNLYDGTTWKSAGGGISQWVTAFNYAINDIVVYAGEIYQALTAHTSTVFLTDLGDGDWVKIADTIQVKGLNQSTATFKTIVAPNNQVTSIGSSQALIETRNTNLLVNPSFEHSTYDTGWTCTGTGTESEDNSIFIDGAASKKVVTSSQTMDCAQTSTLYAAQVAGVQGVVTAWIKSTSAISEVCAVADSVDTKCVTIEANNTWKEYVIPFVMGSTNNGVRVKSASDSGTTYIDNAFVGVMPATMMPNVENISQWTDYGAITITATTTNPTKATTRQQDNVRCRVVGQDYECEYRYQHTSNVGAAAGSGGYLFHLPEGVEFADDQSLGTISTATGASGDAANGSRNSAKIGYGTTVANASSSHNTPYVYAVSSNRFQACLLNGATNGGCINSTFYSLGDASLSYMFNIKFKGKNIGAYTKIYSGDTIYPHAQSWGKITFDNTCLWTITQAAYTSNFSDDATCGASVEGTNVQVVGNKNIAVTLPNAPAGKYLLVYTGSLYKNNNNAFSCRFRFYDGTNSIGEGSVYTGSATVVPTLHGDITYTTSGTRTIYMQAMGDGGAANCQIGATGSAHHLSVYYFPPKDNPIIGTFEGIERCSDAYECSDTFSAKVSSAGVVSDENLDWINGNCTIASTSIYTCTFNTGIFSNTPNCRVGANDSSATFDFVQVVNTSSSAQLTYVAKNSTGTNTAKAAIILCQKQGSDYKPKTAKAATTNEMMYVPNIVRPKTCYYAFGGAGSLTAPANCTSSPCTEYYDSCSAVTPPTRSSTGVYPDLTFANGTWKADTFISCSVSPQNATTSNGMVGNIYFVTGDNRIATNSSGGFVTNVFTYNPGAGVFNDTFVVVSCTADAP